MSNWDPGKHPRAPAGSAQGGQFIAGDYVSIDNGNFGKGMVVGKEGEHYRIRVTTLQGPKGGLYFGSEAERKGSGLFHQSRLTAIKGMENKNLSRPPRLVNKEPMTAQRAMRAADTNARQMLAKVESGQSLSAADRQKMTNITARARTLSGTRYVPSGRPIRIDPVNAALTRTMTSGPLYGPRLGPSKKK